jgi:hypothetical protein
MKKVLAVLIVATVAASALAGVDIFVTSANPANAGYIGGLANPGLNFDPTGDAQRDVSPFTNPLYRLDRNVAIQYTPVVPTINPLTDGDTLYIWFQFNHETLGTKVQGLQLGWNSTVPLVDKAYYVVDNALGDEDDGSAPLGKRWDGAYQAAADPEFKMNPQILAAVQTWGLPRANASLRWGDVGDGYGWWPSATGPGYNLQGAYSGTTGRSTIYLLGALKVAPGNYDLTPIIGELGIAYDGGVQYPTQHIYGARITPEPASLLLIGLGLLLRRR